jgi:hypothetical protein
MINASIYVSTCPVTDGKPVFWPPLYVLSDVLKGIRILIMSDLYNKDQCWHTTHQTRTVSSQLLNSTANRFLRKYGTFFYGSVTISML